MPPHDPVANYEQLADQEDKAGAAQMRDRFLILAADAALTLGQHERAEKLRARLLEQNPHHLLRPYSSLADAMKSPDVFSYVVDLRSTYPPDEAERLLGVPPGSKPEEPQPLRHVAPEPTTPHEPEIYPIGRGATEPEPLETAPAHEFAPPEPAPPAEPPRRARLKRVHAAEEAATEAPDVYPYQTTQLPGSARQREAAEPVSALCVWVSTTLFVLLLVAGLALAGYTLARPFLPL